jgi:Zn-dependent protease
MFRIGRVAGADVLIDPSLLLIGPLIVLILADQFSDAAFGNRYVMAAAFVIALYASIFTHEFAHLLMGRATGRQASRIELMLFGGVTLFDRGAAGPGQQFLTAIVGPIASLAVGAVSLFVAHSTTSWVGAVAWSLGVTNVFLGLFNLLPGLPLDGGQAMRAAVWKLTGRQAAGIIATAWIGRVIAVALVVASLWISDLSRSDWVVNLGFALLVAWTMWEAASQALRYVERGGNA